MARVGSELERWQRLNNVQKENIINETKIYMKNIGLDFREMNFQPLSQIFSLHEKKKFFNVFCHDKTQQLLKAILHQLI